ncbi:MAG: response regulator transcription factor [Thermoanaerobaculia bacterium]
MKDVNPLQQLKTSIENLSSGDDLLSRKQEMLSLLESIAVSYPGNGNGNGHHGETQHLRLSPREREVMGMILTGRRLKEIAATLDISVKTVTTHRSRLLRKLGIEDNLGLFRYGVRNGLISV